MFDISGVAQMSLWAVQQARNRICKPLTLHDNLCLTTCYGYCTCFLR